MKKLVILLFIGSFIMCQDNDNVETQPIDGVQVRIRNSSEYDFFEVGFNNPSRVLSFNTIASGTTSAYQFIPAAYPYGAIKLSIDEKIYTLQPIDYLSDEAYTTGNFTYEIRVSELKDQYDTLQLTFHID